MAASQSTSSRALLYFSERVEDATEAVKGLLGKNGGSGGGGGAARYVDASDDHVRAQLESDRDQVRIEGLKTVISLISKGREASGYFPSVVKLSSNANLEIRKLVYIIVRRYALRQPELALLGINSFQRDLQDHNEVVRAMALRVLTGLRLRLAESVVELALGKSIRDSSFYVRKASALALIKNAVVVPEARATYAAHVKTLLRDSNPNVLGAALLAWSAVCPDALEVLHPHFRKLCYALADMDEWSQNEGICILGYYAKRCLPRPPNSTEEKMDKDLDLLLVKVKDLLHSANAAVVTAASRLLFALAPQTRHAAIAGPLVRLVNRGDDTAYIALCNCLYIANVSPNLLEPYFCDFIPRSSLQEHGYCTVIKMQVMVRVATPKTAELLLSELLEEAQLHPDETVAASAIEQLGFWAGRCDDRQRRICLRKLIQLLKDRKARDSVVAQALLVIREIVERGREEDAKLTIPRLSFLLFTSAPLAKEGKRKSRSIAGKILLQSSVARATIFWLLGHYCRLSIKVGKDSAKERTIAEVIGLDVLRKAAANFVKEEASAKLQILTFSTKLFTFLPTVKGVETDHLKALTLLHRYILQLARYDGLFDVRDRARLYKALTDRLEASVTDATAERGADSKAVLEGDVDEQLGGVILRREQVMHILFEEKVLNTTKSAEHESSEAALPPWNVLREIVGPKACRMLVTRYPDFFVEPWADPSSLPPTSVREIQEPLSAPRSTEGSSNGVSAQAQGPSESGGLPISHDSPSSITKQVRAPFIGKEAKTKYKDLDAFLDAEEDSDDGGGGAEETSENDDSLDPYEEEDVEEESADDEEDEEDEDEDEEETTSSDSDSASESAQKTSSNRVRLSVQATSLATPLPAEENAWA